MAAELVDFALGTDCGGSVRLPASYCGILGIRPSLGRISLEGVVPFSASFDVVGWFARDVEVLARVGAALFDEPRPARMTKRILIAEDAFRFADQEVRAALVPAVLRVLDRFETRDRIRDDRLETWLDAFRLIQAWEVWANHGAWIERHNPVFGPGIRERMNWASKVMADQVEPARKQHKEIRSRLGRLLGEADVLCLPTSPCIASLKNAPLDDIETRVRHQAMCLLCISGLGGLPQVSLPLAELDGMPLGLSFIARPGNDETLLELAKAIME